MQKSGKAGIGALLLLFFAWTPCGQTIAADQIHWTFTGQTSVTVDWKGTPQENVIRYGTSANNTRSATAHAPSPMPFSSEGSFWEAKIDGLEENKTYHFTIGSDGRGNTFHTSPPAGASGFTIFVEGDIGAARTYPPVAGVQDVIAKDMPDFVLMVGDLSYGHPYGQKDVEDHFNNVMVWSRSAAYMPTWGNHEWDNPKNDDLRNYKGRFDFPNPESSPGSPTCCGKDWYWFDHGNTRFIVYPEPYNSAAWTDWKQKAEKLMDQAQSDPKIRFIVTAGHRPAYSSGAHPGSSSLKGILDGLGDRHGKYVLNLNGHSHDYERTHPQHGVVHVTVGTGGAMGESEKGPCPWKGGCPPPPFSAFRAFHTGALKLAFQPTGIDGSFICGPPAPKDDVSCHTGGVLDSFKIPLSSKSR